MELDAAERRLRVQRASRFVDESRPVADGFGTVASVGANDFDTSGDDSRSTIERQGRRAASDGVRGDGRLHRAEEHPEREAERGLPQECAAEQGASGVRRGR
ncbi:hypothetical protein [Streptomyces puniciscabiei]|uniref:hypothetical protein n=1 Tax=Streptomyces puniciscabiei TaxID=164348 RepID=UPI00332485C5